MDEDLREQIYNNLSLRETEDLIDIFQKKNIDEWDVETFEIIKEILSERLGYIPIRPIQLKAGQFQSSIDTEEHEGKFDKELEDPVSAVQKKPDIAIEYYQRGLIYEDMGQLDKAIADYQEAIRLGPELKGAWENLLRVETEIEREFQRSTTKEHLDKAFEYANRKESVKALKECELAKENMPGIGIAYNYLGMILEELEQLESSLEAYLEAIRLNPRFQDAWDNVEIVTGEITERFQQSSAKQHLDLAREHVYHDEPEQALDECELARPTMAGTAIAYNYLGMILDELEQLEGAIEAYLEAIRLNPKFYAARENLANARVMLEEEQYRQVYLGDLRGGRESESGNGKVAISGIDESQYSIIPDNNNPVPGWVYMGEQAFLLSGWPGHRTRPGRSGYDPLDTDFEEAHILGCMFRLMLDRKFRTHNPLYLLLMTFTGFIVCLPLLLGGLTFLQGDMFSIVVLFIFSPYWIVGIALLINVYMSMQLERSDEDDNGNAFF